ncbi:type I restriction endonuclease subunit R [Treponema succinifaciens]|uniref:Type I site-specific deoxyribonuclease n=2 Tax=Treponema TaxID=157 RepID=F2NXF0_TRES6|nr:type I restriction endonuclease subunit R [Treponema succinifaciens]AEB14029.1 Type I site-specific deoxyribonuclease [Treponema succinifaciens DSM 2489]
MAEYKIHHSTYDLDSLLPEQKARVKIDQMLKDSGWTVVPRDDFTPDAVNAQAVEENLMKGNLEADYILYLDGKAIAVLEAKREENKLGLEVAEQAQNYGNILPDWVQAWKTPLPFIFLCNGDLLLFKDMREAKPSYKVIKKMFTPKEIVNLAGDDIKSQFAKLPALPPVGPKGLRECQFEAITNLEISFKQGLKKALIVLATGAGKTFTACTAAYRLLNYMGAKRVLFLVDRNNLGKQAEGEFGTYKLTETGNAFSDEYIVHRLRSVEKIGNASVVISTIQRLFAALTGQEVDEPDDDEEMEHDEDTPGKQVQLTGNVLLPSDFFDVIIIDECHRSIYGDWQQVLTYFNNAKIIGLTATPTPEAMAFFNKNRIVNYTLEKSIADGVNVPPRVYRIKTEISEAGGTLNEGEKVTKVSNLTGKGQNQKQKYDKDYTKTELDRSVVVPSQIETVVRAYKDAIYESLYPEREKNWYMIPKTLFFAKKESHAQDILKAIEKVFKDEFPDKKLPEHFAQLITCKSGNSNQLISDFRNNKDFRIAITVTLVATGTDVRPLEVLVFMRDINSEVLYTQMKGRGCRTIDDDKLRNVTTNANSKDFYYLIDAVGVTEHEKSMPTPNGGEGRKKVLSLKDLLEHLAHGEVSNENLNLLAGYLSNVNKKAEPEDLIELNELIKTTAIKQICLDIYAAIDPDNKAFPEYKDINDPNTERKALISALINNVKARKKLLEVNAGFIKIAVEETDKLISAGFSKEQSKQYIDSFEKYLEENKDEVEALRILYNQKKVAITYSMLKDLEKKLLAYNNQFKSEFLWTCYQTLNGESGKVKPLNKETELGVLTNLIPLVRYGYKIDNELVSLKRRFGSYFNLYCGQAWRKFKPEQVEIVQQIAEYIVQNGCITNIELNKAKHDLFVKAIPIFGADKLNNEMQTISKYLFYGKAA